MVRTFFICFMLTLGLVDAQDIKIAASVEDGKAYENQPVKVLISITHDITQKVDQNSFSSEGKPIEVEFIQQVEVAPPKPLVISYYRFQLPPQPSGLRLLSEISVKVGGKAYISIPSSYVVEVLAPKAPSQASRDTILQLLARVDSTPLIYPGQRFNVVYRYMFNRSIELTEEQLPLLNPEGFAKVGSKEAHSYQKGNMSILEITQKLEAVKPGSYEIPPSKIAGYAYQIDSYGNKTYQKPQLEAEQPGITLTVALFPEEGMPPSFNGAIGPYDSFKGVLKSPSTIYVGDKIDLALTIGGQGQLENAPLPELCCQPGFSGIFKMSDFPPAREIKDKELMFNQELRPLTDGVQQVPSIEFSFFLPQEGKYSVLNTDPIPLTLLPVPLSQEQATQQKDVASEGPQVSFEVPQIEIAVDLPLSETDLTNIPFGSWSVLYQIPFAIIGFWVIKRLHQYRLKKRLQIKIKNSRDLFSEAMNSPPSSPQFYHLIHQAFHLKMAELGAASAEVLIFLGSLEEHRYAGRMDEIGALQVNEARQLFDKMGAAFMKSLLLLLSLLLMAGLNGENAVDRRDAYNDTLKFYLDLENQYRPTHGNGNLYFDIGNAYYRLGEYPLAIFYYYRSLSLTSRNQNVRNNLEKALAKQQLPLPKAVLFPYSISTSEKFRLLFLIGIGIIALLFTFAWHPNRKLKVGMVFLGTLYIGILGNLLYSHYFEPLQGVLIRAAPIYKDAGKQYAKATPDPMPAGLKVDVLDIKEKGQWLKIMAPDGVLGYVNLDSIQIL